VPYRESKRKTKAAKKAAAKDPQGTALAEQEELKEAAASGN